MELIYEVEVVERLDHIRPEPGLLIQLAQGGDRDPVAVLERARRCRGRAGCGPAHAEGAGPRCSERPARNGPPSNRPGRGEAGSCDASVHVQGRRDRPAVDHHHRCPFAIWSHPGDRGGGPWRRSTIGPSARRIHAISRDPALPGSIRPTPRIVTLVSVKPIAVWSDSADPRSRVGPAPRPRTRTAPDRPTTGIPQMSATRTMRGWAPNRRPATTADVAEVAIAAIVVAVRPTRSAMPRATAEPTPPRRHHRECRQCRSGDRSRRRPRSSRSGRSSTSTSRRAPT